MIMLGIYDYAVITETLKANGFITEDRMVDITVYYDYIYDHTDKISLTYLDEGSDPSYEAWIEYRDSGRKMVVVVKAISDDTNTDLPAADPLQCLTDLVMQSHVRAKESPAGAKYYNHRADTIRECMGILKGEAI